MFYNKIFLLDSYGYKIMTPIDWKNESRQVYPIIARKMTEYEGIKVCYQILIYDTSLNIHFESVSILGHKYGYVAPLYHQQLTDNIGSVIKQFELYTQNNITNNLSYYNYDINNIRLFTNDTYVGMNLFQEALIARNNLRRSMIEVNSPLDDRISNTTTNDRIEDQKLIDDINRQAQNLLFRSERSLGSNLTVSVISENEIKVDLKKQLANNDLNVLEKPYEIRQVDDINNIDENVKKMLDVGFIMYSAKHNSKYVYQGNNEWKPLRKENKNKDKLLNVDRDKTWKRI